MTVSASGTELCSGSILEGQCNLTLTTAGANRTLTATYVGDAASLGILMNTRGLVELIVLNIGLDLGVLSPTLFAMLVIMAIVTTVATTPILDRLLVKDDAREARDLVTSEPGG